MALADRNSSDADLLLHLLVLRCQAGDDGAFARLIDRFGPKTLVYLTGLIGTDADDVQQEVWLAVYRTIRTLADPRAFRTWLFRLTRHRAIDWLRRAKRERELFDDATPAELVAEPAAGDEESPWTLEPELGAALAGLSAPQREVLLLRYRDDMTYAEIALVVGCPIGTVRTRLHHAKRKLQQLLERGSS